MDIGNTANVRVHSWTTDCTWRSAGPDAWDAKKVLVNQDPAPAVISGARHAAGELDELPGFLRHSTAAPLRLTAAAGAGPPAPAEPCHGGSEFRALLVT